MLAALAAGLLPSAARGLLAAHGAASCSGAAALQQRALSHASASTSGAPFSLPEHEIEDGGWRGMRRGRGRSDGAAAGARPARRAGLPLRLPPRLAPRPAARRPRPHAARAAAAAATAACPQACPS
jgi:hypothetical protein